MKKLYFTFVLVAFVCSTLGFGQIQTQQASQPQATPGPAAQATPQPLSKSPAKTNAEPEKPPHKITPQEAQELFQSLDEILHFASKDTLLPIKHPVKRALVNREQVEKYVGDKFENDVDRIRFERSELVLKKFGLLPRKFNLHDFLIKLLGEQVAGYYDEKNKTMNMLDWVDMDMQRPVMAHELTHALQDQSFDLEKMAKKDDEIERRGPEDPNALIEIDEQSTARTAVIEGQAMIVFLDYVLAPNNESVEKMPKLLDMVESTMQKSGDSPIFDSAPVLIKEELVFPYTKGMKFIKELLVNGGKALAYKGVLTRMPLTSREILEPQEYLAGRRIPPLLLPDLAFLKKDYEPFDAGAVGELDVDVLLKIYADEAVAKRLSPEWRGGSYYAAGRKGVKPSDPNSSAHVGLFYISKWSTPAAAQEFAKIYASSLPSHYNALQRVTAGASKPGLEKYSSSDGPIFIQQSGNVVVTVESFDEANAAKLLDAGLKAAQQQLLPGAQQQNGSQ